MKTSTLALFAAAAGAAYFLTRPKPMGTLSDLHDGETGDRITDDAGAPLCIDQAGDLWTEGMMGCTPADPDALNGLAGFGSFLKKAVAIAKPIAQVALPIAAGVLTGGVGTAAVLAVQVAQKVQEAKAAAAAAKNQAAAEANAQAQAQQAYDAQLNAQVAAAMANDPQAPIGAGNVQATPSGGISPMVWVALAGGAFLLLGGGGLLAARARRNPRRRGRRNPGRRVRARKGRGKRCCRRR